MLLSLAVMVLAGFLLGGIFGRLGLPALLGMLVTGIVVGPHALNLVAPEILAVSAELRQMALIVILLRAGLGLDLSDLRRVGRPALLMSFIPATVELAAATALAPALLGITRLEGAVLGCVLAAVSPAVVVPRMLRLMEEGYGREKGIPQMVMAAASVDDVYVIVMFTALLGMAGGGGFSPGTLVRVPVSVLCGALLGLAAGRVLALLFRRVHMRDTVKLLLILAVCFLFVELESAVAHLLPVSGLLAVMALGLAIRRYHRALGGRLADKYARVWVAAELLLFVLVGAAVEIRALGGAGLTAVALILSALLLRACGVLLCLVKTALGARERLFAAIAYLPKATVQAAIGGVPLAMGLPAGETILTVAVLAILITATLGAVAIDRSYRRLLTR